MLTQQDKEKLTRNQLESSIRIFEDAIAKAEKYERLKENKDWQGYLKDLQVVVDIHAKEISQAEGYLPDAPATGYVKTDEFGKQQYVSSRSDWMDFIVRHYIQKKQLMNWIEEPERILKMAALSRERLPVLKAKLEDLSHATEPSGNGKP